MSSRTAFVTSALACTLTSTLAAACSGGSSPAAAPSASASASATTAATAPASSPSPTLPFVADTEPDTGQSSGGPLGLKAVRAAPQTGYDRVVFELAGKVTGTAGWTVQYVEAPRSDGAGDPVAVKGSAYLEVILTGTGYPADTGVPEPTTKRFTPAGTPTLKEVVLSGVFEGQYTAFIGTSSTLPFRVMRLGNPERVVVDVRRS